MEPRDEITIERPTGPRITMADPASKGQVASYRAGRAVTARPSAKAFAALIALGVILPAILGLAWIYAKIETYEAFSSTVGPFTVDANGWTVLQPTTTTSGTCAGGPSATANGTCIYYIDSAAGVDDNTNCIGYLPPVTTSPTTACKTYFFAVGRFRTTKPDWALFKRGQTHTMSARRIFGGNLGQDATHPFVVSAYPLDPVTYDDRPVIDLAGSAANDGIFFQAQSGFHQVAFVSLRITISRYNPNSPNYWSSVPPTVNNSFVILSNPATNFLLIEDIEFSYGTAGLNLLPTSSVTRDKNIYIRRNVFFNDAPPITGFLLSESVDGMVVEENLFRQGYAPRYGVASTVTITSASPAVITYAAANTTPPESGGLPPFGVFGDPPRIGLSGPVPTGLSTTVLSCTNGGTCYHLCNISGNTANLGTSATCATLVNTTGSACNAGCSAKWNDAGANIFSHNAYLDLGWNNNKAATLGNIVYRNNITAYASATGSQIRPGGTYYNNLYLKNPLQITGVGWPTDLGYNVALQAVDMQMAIAPAARGWGSLITNYYCVAPAADACTQARVDNPPTTGSSGTRIHHNILAKSEATLAGGAGIKLEAAQVFGGFGGNLDSVRGVTVESNTVCDWPTALNTPYNDQGIGNTLATSNKPNPQTSNVDTTCAALGLTPATVGEYYTSIGGPGGATTDDFLDYCKAHWTKISWLDACMAKAANAYIRPTYGLTNPPDTRTVRMTVQ